MGLVHFFSDRLKDQIEIKKKRVFRDCLCRLAVGGMEITMALFNVNFFSKSLAINTNMTVIMPQDTGMKKHRCFIFCTEAATIIRHGCAIPLLIDIL
mgnify:CR=1 FL=1